MPSNPTDLGYELERLSAELQALPLSNENRQRRLALNQRKLKVEAELVALRTEATRLEQQAQVAQLNQEMRALGETPPERVRRRDLRRQIAALEAEMEMLPSPPR